MDTGPIVRRRECAKCKNRWYTNQDPEYMVASDRVRYVDKRLHHVEDVYKADEEALALERDAARYRWLKKQETLSLQTHNADRKVGNGRNNVRSPTLLVNGTRFNDIGNFDDLIDRGMEMYPNKKT
jgi:hypothetical protein